ncbi:MAG: S8 family serine peptidase [Clostridiales bacterium]
MGKKFISVILASILIISFASTSVVPVFAYSKGKVSKIKKKDETDVSHIEAKIKDNIDFSKVRNETKSETRYIIKYKKGKEKEVKNKLIKKMGTKKLKKQKNIKGSDSMVVELDKTNSKEYLFKALSSDANIEYIQEDYVVEFSSSPDDTYYSLQWGLNNYSQAIAGITGQSGIDISAEETWRNSDIKEEIIVAVLDTGVDIKHPDLKNNIWTNDDEIAGNGIDDDGNGYIDDVNGWNFVDETPNVYNSAVEDFHGTHVSGIIAAEHNSIGVTGVAKNVKIMPLKFISGTGRLSDEIEAINYAKDNGAIIVNCSFGQYNFSQLEYDTYNSTDMLFIASSGNDAINNDLTKHYPSDYNLDNIISVGALQNDGNLASFSNFGMESVDIAAPGHYIASTSPESGYSYASGTSMASPYVSGVAAILKGNNPDLTTAKIKDKLLNNAVKLPNLATKIKNGNILKGNIDVVPPHKPVGLSTNAVNEDSVSIIWDESTDNVGILGYEVYLDDELITKTMETSFDFENLNSDKTYEAYVIAYDAKINKSEKSDILSISTKPIVMPKVSNVKNNYNNLAKIGSGREALFVSDQFNNAFKVMTDGIKESYSSADSWDNSIKKEDYWGLSFDKTYGFNKVIYYAGHTGKSGGWFTSDLRVQVMQNNKWINVKNLSFINSYPYDETAGPNKSYEIIFDDTWGNAIRIVGQSNGVEGYEYSFTSIGELEVYYWNYNNKIYDFVDVNGEFPSVENSKNNKINLVKTENVTSIYSEDQYGNSLNIINDGKIENGLSANSWNGEIRDEDYWGVEFGKNYGFNQVKYATGSKGENGGWFESDLKVQVRQNGVWKNVYANIEGEPDENYEKSLVKNSGNMTPSYPYNDTANPDKIYEFNFKDTWGDAVRIIGKPKKVDGYTYVYTSIKEFEVYYKANGEIIFDDPIATNTTIYNLKNSKNYINLSTTTGVTEAISFYDQFNNSLEIMTDEGGTNCADSWNGSIHERDYWGLMMDGNYGYNKIVFNQGYLGKNSGWFEYAPKVQVRQDGEWKDATSQRIFPEYKIEELYDKNFEINFDDTWGDGIRIIGIPYFNENVVNYSYTTIKEFEIYYEGVVELPQYELADTDLSQIKNSRSGFNLANEMGISAVYDADQYGNALNVMRDGFKTNCNSANSWDGNIKSEDYWGYSFNEINGFNKLVYTSGHTGVSGGWFENNLRVQVRQNGKWKEVTKIESKEIYPYDISAGPDISYEYKFEDTWGDAVRIVGIPHNVPGFTYMFTSIQELEVYFEGENSNNEYAESLNDNISIVNQRSGTNISSTEYVTSAVFITDQFNNALNVMTDGNRWSSADSWNGNIKTEDYWGLMFTENLGFNKLIYSAGHVGESGGWFESNLKVQVLQNEQWFDVENLSFSPIYSYNSSTNYSDFIMSFDTTWGMGIRIIGNPVYVNGYNYTYTSIQELETYFE